MSEQLKNALHEVVRQLTIEALSNINGKDGDLALADECKHMVRQINSLLRLYGGEA